MQALGASPAADTYSRSSLYSSQTGTGSYDGSPVAFQMTGLDQSPEGGSAQRGTARAPMASIGSGGSGLSVGGAEVMDVKAVAIRTTGAVLDEAFAWARLYAELPQSTKTLFELEGLIAKRLDLLAFIMHQFNSPKARNIDEVLTVVCQRISGERRALYAINRADAGTSAGGHPNNHDDMLLEERALAIRQEDLFEEKARPSSTSLLPVTRGRDVDVSTMTREDDLISFHLCRLAFCLDENWRRWFMRAEELLLRARIRNIVGSTSSSSTGGSSLSSAFGIAQAMLQLNEVCAQPLTPSQVAHPMVKAFFQYNASLSQYTAGYTLNQRANHSGNPSNPNLNYNANKVLSPHRYFSVPISLVPKLIRERKVLLLFGRAIISEDHALELVLSAYRRLLQRGLHEAYEKRMKLLGAVAHTARPPAEGDAEADDSAAIKNDLPLLYNMMDAFLKRYVTDATDDNLNSAKSGSITWQDIPAAIAHNHFPLCMVRIDEQLRELGHLKHQGRLMYGLFLKQIGLSVNDALTLFGTLMTVKGGGSREAFEKSQYGYHVRHNYGLEGAKKDYSSFSCNTIINQPPAIDRFDCHGCPFRFRDEGALRRLLLSPAGHAQGPGHLTATDIEDIIADSKGSHYTRACYKYFVATHPNAQRDTLFRSPLEYYTISREVEKRNEERLLFAKKPEDRTIKSEAPSGGSPMAGAKRRHQATLLSNATRHKSEE